MNRNLKFKQTEDQKVYWVSDTHFNHDRDFVYGARGFKSSKEHTDFVINKINEIVRPNDILVHLGDFCLNTTESQFEELLSRINCQNIHALWGNHNSRIWDAYKREIQNQFSRDIEVYPFRYKNLVFIGNYAEVIVDGRYFILSHYPIYVWNYIKDSAVHLCGHSHYNLPFSQADNLNSKILDIGWDGFGRPLSTQEILEIMAKKSVFETGDHHKKI